MKKTLAILLFISLTLPLFSCGGNNGGDTTTPDTTAPPTETTAAITGTLQIGSLYAWVGYPDAQIAPVFTNPSEAEAIKYTYDTEGLYIDEETNTVKPLKAGKYTVTAKSEHFETKFTVTAEEVDKAAEGPSGVKYDSSKFSAIAEDRLNTWKENGNPGMTTIFIGDSYFDTNFWSNFYTEYYSGKDALCLGISSATTYDIENWANEWIYETAPKAIVIHVGTNNVYDDGDKESDVVSALQRMFTVLHETFPSVPIYWFNITQRWYNEQNQKIVEKVNERMQKWCDARDYVTCIDTSSLITAEMLFDLTHPSLENYKVFTDALENSGYIVEDKK